ncbi:MULTISPECIES: hypothetical protein [Inquilinus]|uniref:Uncharacterized protein n=1 Tax=Inquilinus ginsengisoli TaxID=363840 RepID=A0ABU1JRN6_9PROT|nr:hypothetical protein [Inquilinus ginsengisoli]MDR6290978.1 hypothetical protein [Inquilinus ginsengisoli]
MLKARLREQQEEARRQAEDRRDGRQRETAERRRGVAEGVIRAIDAATPNDSEARERLTGDLWTRLDRIDADRADTVLPIEILVRRLCRALGLLPDWPDLPADEAEAAGLAAKAAVVGRGAAGLGLPRRPPGHRRWSPRPDRIRNPDPTLPRKQTDTS